MISVKNHHTPPTMRPDRDLIMYEIDFLNWNEYPERNASYQIYVYAALGNLENILFMLFGKGEVYVAMHANDIGK